MALVVVTALSSCSSKKTALAAPTTSTQQNIEVRHERVIDTVTIYVRVPEQTAERTTNDSTSFLETKFAESRARINPDGSLTHTLSAKAQEMPIDVPTIHERVDSVATRIVTKSVPVPIEKDLTWWQKVCVKSAPVLLVLLSLALVYIFRAPLLKTGRRVLKIP
jgi:hypothetical protein